MMIAHVLSAAGYGMKMMIDGSAVMYMWPEIATQTSNMGHENTGLSSYILSLGLANV